MELVVSTPPTLPDYQERLLELWERTGELAMERLASGRHPFALEVREPLASEVWVDWLSTGLMHTFKTTGDPQVFAALYEANRVPFLLTIRGRVRCYHPGIDPGDVLQEVFLNIFRYPHHFKAEAADSFRKWGFRIVRNTMLKAFKGEARDARFRSLDDELVLPRDRRSRDPETSAAQAESAVLVNRAYLLYLNLYLIQYQQLSPRERRALSLVEVEGVTYRQAAVDLGIRLENLKMVIFRGRRKIYRGLEKTLEDMNLGLSLARPVPSRCLTR